ncbi:MAG: helix-turn-helix transcriptional regulator [Nitriliruptoraceae bacterium]
MRFEPAQIEAFAARLADARAAKGWTRQQVVDAVDGVSEPQQIYNYEQGRRAPERADVVMALERALDLPAGALCRHLGFGPVDEQLAPAEVADAIAADPRLSLDAKRQLLSAYRRLTR